MGKTLANEVEVANRYVNVNGIHGEVQNMLAFPL